ncbi:MAG: aldehyde dehydrogenase family protein [Rhodopseudomonas palustris]|nr:aldehyde dehydrogenase family protein [Rhodopseudomonas palustris]
MNAMIVDSHRAARAGGRRRGAARPSDSAGQRCSALRAAVPAGGRSPTRVIEMLARRDARAARRRPGASWRTDVGPVIDAEARAGIERAHRSACSAEARLLPSAAAAGAAPRHLRRAATLIEIDRIAELTREVFGPVLHVRALSSGERARRSVLDADQRHRLRPDARRAHAASTAASQTRRARCARRQRLRQPQHDRRRGRRAAVRRRGPVRHRPEGRRAALPAALLRRADADHQHRGHRAATPPCSRLRSDGAVSSSLRSERPHEVPIPVIASAAKQSSSRHKPWIASSLRSSQ